MKRITLSLWLVLAVLTLLVTAPVTIGSAEGEIVTLRAIYPGEEPVRYAQTMAAINAKMEKDIGVRLELTFKPWNEYYNLVKMDIGAGEEIDFHWGGSSDLQANYALKVVAPIDEYMEAYGQSIYDNINPDLFNSMRINGLLYGIPSTGNAPISNVYHSMTYREDLRLKYNLPEPNTIENLELYMETILTNEGIVPLQSKSTAYVIMLEFGIEDFLGGTSGSVLRGINDDGTVYALCVQDSASLMGAMKKVREWYLKGYIPTDILNSDPGASFAIGMGALTNGSALSASEQQARVASNVPGAVLRDQPFHGSGKKYLGGNGGNALYLSPTSKHPEKVIQFWAWVFASQENFDLYCYGIEGEDYVLENDRIAILEGSDWGSMFPGWMFKNMNYLRFMEGITDDYIDSIKHWDDGAVMSPLANFSFNPSNVETELAQFSAVWGEYTTGLYSGALDLDVIIPEFNDRAKAAGQDKILAEVNAQLEAYFADK